MTDAEREALATAMRLAFADADGCGQARMRAALAVAETVVREDEREACAAMVEATSDRGGYDAYSFRDAPLVASAIRARGAA